MNLRWIEGPAFAEIAEAIGIPTDQVMGSMNADEATLVLYTTEASEEYDPTCQVWGVTLRRDGDGIYYKATSPSPAGKVGDYLPDEEVG